MAYCLFISTSIFDKGLSVLYCLHFKSNSVLLPKRNFHKYGENIKKKVNTENRTVEAEKENLLNSCLTQTSVYLPHLVFCNLILVEDNYYIHGLWQKLLLKKLGTHKRNQQLYVISKSFLFFVFMLSFINSNGAIYYKQ